MMMIIWFGFVLGALSAAGKVVIKEVGEKAVIECGIKARHALTWSHGLGIIYTHNPRSGASSKGKSPITLKSKVINEANLQINHVEESDAGKFTCLADSVPYEHTLIVVSVSVHPSRDLLLGSALSLHCRVTEPDKTSQVQWKKPDGSFENSPTVDLKHADSSHDGIWQYHVTNSDVHFEKNVSITVRVPTPKPVPEHPIPNIPGASNFPGSSSANDNDSTCNNCKPGTSGPVLLGLIWWIWVAIGVGSLIVIILLIVVIVMVRRMRRRKRKLLKMKKAKLSQKTKKYCQCERQTAAPKPRQGHRRAKPSAPPLQPLLME